MFFSSNIVFSWFYWSVELLSSKFENIFLTLTKVEQSDELEALFIFKFSVFNSKNPFNIQSLSNLEVI